MIIHRLDVWGYGVTVGDYSLLNIVMDLYFLLIRFLHGGEGNSIVMDMSKSGFVDGDFTIGV